LINNLLWRNLKANITTQYEVPDLTTEEIKLKFNSVEAAAYEYMKCENKTTIYYVRNSDESLRQFCDGFLRVRDTMTEEREYYISRCKVNIL